MKMKKSIERIKSTDKCVYVNCYVRISGGISFHIYAVGDASHYPRGPDMYPVISLYFCRYLG